MAEQRTPGSGGTSPAPERGSQGHDTTQEVSTQITETARQVGETASQYYEQGVSNSKDGSSRWRRTFGPSRCNPSCWPRGLVCSWDYSRGNSWCPGAAPREGEKRTTRPARRS